MSNGPTGGRRDLADGLRAARQATGRTAKEWAEQLGLQRSKMSRIERGDQIATEHDVRLLTEAYGTPEAERSRLLDLAREVRALNQRVVSFRDPWTIQHRIAQWENDATLVREFFPTIVPGLLQTRDYIRAIMMTARWANDETAVATAIAGRLQRQALLDRDDDPRRWVILLTEGSLGWALGPPEMMLEQVEQVTAATYRRNVRVGIIPFGTRADVAAAHSWDLYDQDAVLVGTLTNTTILDQPADVARYVALTDTLERLAVYGDDARQVLRHIADRYRSL